MRLDKYLKVSRLIKRRTVANEACDAGRVVINGKVAKASADVKAGDVIEIAFGNKSVKVRVTDVKDTVNIQFSFFHGQPADMQICTFNRNHAAVGFQNNFI